MIQTSFLNRFLNYVRFNTQANSASESVPSTQGQKKLATALHKEIRALGLSDVSLDGNGYLMAKIPANFEPQDKPVPAIGFIAHMDTAPDASGEGVRPQIVENYNGDNIVLQGVEGMVLSPADFPALNDHIGKTLVTTDGTTLLGADNKAGIAAILTAAEYLLSHPEIQHGDICIGFTPDEEIGRGADHFDVSAFGADWAYTIDGSAEGELEYENFNAASAKVICRGRNVHPGYAKDTMINAMTLARHFSGDIPADEVPEQTDGYEGFYHLHSMSGTEEQAELNYLIRDFDRDSFEQRKQLMLDLAGSINSRLDGPRVEVEIKDSYANMREQLEKVPHVVELAMDAMREIEIEPVIKPIRGGTDGARLSYMGLPCPNIFTGGHNFHGRHEYLVVETAMKSVETIVSICRLAAEK